MPVIPSSTITDITKKKDRARLQFMLAERSVLGYTFSWEKLLTLASELLNMDADDCPDLAAKLVEAVCAFKEEDAKAIKEALNEEIAEIYTQYGIETLEHPDPFGNNIVFLMMHSHSTSFKKADAMELLVRRFKLDAKDVSDVFKECTKSSPFTTVQARRVKSNDEGKSK